MAIKRVAYSCEHKCKRRIILSKTAMEDHEKICFWNPERKACITCKHYDHYEDGNGLDGTPYEEVYVVRGCLLEHKDLSKRLHADCLMHKVKE